MKASPQAEAIVYQFYDNIGEKDFKAAWNLLASRYQNERWHSDFGWFQNGYENFVSIQGLTVFLRSSEPHLATFDAFYEEEQMQPVILPLHLLENMTVGQVRAGLLDLLDELETDLVRAGGEHSKFEAISFKRLFHADVPVALPWEMKMPSSAIRKVFPASELKILSRGRRFRLSEENGTWRIRRISWLST